MSENFCLPWGPEEYEAIERGWKEQDSPPVPAPPVANVALAIELCTGLDAVREYDFQGVTYRLNPTPYDVGLRLLAWSQELERLAAMLEVLHQHLPELRDCYAEILRLIGTLMVDPTDPNPFLEADAPEVRRLLGFALETGNDLPILAPRHNSDDPAGRYDATFYWLKYVERFGGAPCMVTARGAPTTWRHFSAVMAYMRRADAEAALTLFGTYGATQANEEGQERWIDLVRREAGL